MDLFEQSHNRDSSKYPAYFYISRDMNAQYASTFPIEHKDEQTILNMTNKLMDSMTIVSFAAEREGGWISNNAKD
jgi:hypothetical protein